MSAADTLRRLRGDGFTLGVDDSGRLRVSPRQRITDDIRDEVRYFCAELIELVIAEAAADPDPRGRCLDCRHYSSTDHACGNHVRALLLTPTVSRALAELRQHCPAFTATAAATNRTATQ